MNYTWNVMISWLLLQFLVPAQSNTKEVTIPVSSPIKLECNEDLRVNNIEVAIRRSNTSCRRTFKECSLPLQTIGMIKDICNNQGSCEVDIRNTIDVGHCLFEYGFVNVLYSCKNILDFSCDFESSLCNWFPKQRNNRFMWKRGNNYYYKPPVDHTSASAEGKYVHIYAYNSHIGDVANLEGEQIIAMEQQCLSFWYYTTNSRDSVYVLQNEDVLFNLSSYNRGTWHHIQISLEKKSYDYYNLVFMVVRGSKNSSYFGAIAVDDILIQNQMCNSSILKCDFDSNLCDWKNEDSNLYSWKNQNSQASTYKSGPSTDHSTSTARGYYMYLDSTVETVETVAILEFQNVDLYIPGNVCLTFWYHMFHPYAYEKERLNVSINNELVWTESGNTDDKWKKGAIDLHNRKSISIKFVGILGSYYRNNIDIALDDISLTDGTCTGFIFHEKMCVPIDDKTHKETECPKGYLNIANSRLSFDPEKQDCSEAYDKKKDRLFEECKIRDDSEKCLIDLSADTSDYPECFQLYDFHIIHTCDDVITVYAVVVSTSVIVIVAVSVFAVIVCHFKKRAKSSKLCNIRQHTSVREMIDSSGYNIINYNKMTGITISDIDKSKLEANATNRQPQDINTAFKQEDTIGNTYESLSTNRNPSEHAYESDPIHSIQYQTLTKQRESDKHFYESTEPAQAQTQDNKTLTGQEDDVCHKYELLSTNQNSVEHAYESDVLHLNQYQTLTTQRESDKHLYESTELVQKQNIQTFINQEDDICNKFESLSTNRNPNEHANASDQIHTNQYESLTKQRESDKHVYESTEHATKQEDDICNKYESLSTNRNPKEHAYETDSIHNNQYQTLKNQRESDKHVYESTEHALRVSMD